MSAQENPCVIEPRKGRREESLPGAAVLVFNPEDLASFSARLAQSPRRSQKLYLSEVLTGSCETVPIAIAGPMLGAPQTILVLEKMIALGAKQFVAAGWCGSLQRTVQIGDIVLPSGAISEEGTSAHYPSVDCIPSLELFDLLKSNLRSAGLKIHEGTVWTTDAPFRETCEKVKAFQSDGILAVDMETSALFSVARFRGVDLAVVLIVSDDLSTLEWSHGFKDPAFHESRKKVIKPVLISAGVAGFGGLSKGGK